MMKTFLLAVALASLALAGGCAKGGNGVVPPPITIDIAPASAINANALYPTQSVKLTATPSSGPDLPVTWSLSPAATCTGNPNPCGTLTPVTPATTPPTATYVAPATPISSVTVTATSTTSSVTGTLGITVIPVTVIVTPLTANVGVNLVQKFTAIAVPDDAPQTFTWSPPTCTSGTNCGSISFDPNNSDVAVYTAGSATQGVTVAATSTVMQSNPAVGTSKVAVIASRLPADAYEFWFSGQDNNGDHVAVVGSLHVDNKGVITGVEDVLSASGPEQLTVNSGSYTPISLNNELGTLRLSLSSGATHTYTAVITSSDLIRMVESDSSGITGSGIMQVSSLQQFNAGAQTFAFGFTGVDSTGKRVGYVGMLTTDGNGTITSGMVDTNDNGNTANVCGASPCNVTAGSYKPDQTFPGLWNMTLTSGSSTQHFDFVVGAGVTQTKTAVNTLTLYAISVKDPSAPNQPVFPALSGTMVYQVPMTYNNAAFAGTSVSALVGANANVSLTVGTTDGTSGGTGGAGGFTGTFDQNNNGTIVSVPPAKPFSYTYVASGTAGRYTFQMLGDPNATTVVPPLTFVLYASGANRGFLLDQSSLTVITGTMDPQLPPAGYTPSELPGAYAAVPVPNSNSPLVTPAVENLLLTSPGGQVYNVAGEQNPGNGTLTGTYTMNNNSTGGGTGTITLTSPPAPAVTSYVIYAINGTTIPNPANSRAPNFAITDFMMMGTTSGTPSSIIFAQQ